MPLNNKLEDLIIHHNIENFQGKNPVVTIGTFDGVHLGHRKVIDQLNQIAATVEGESVLFTFYPHPRLILFENEKNLRLITTLDEKIEQLKRAGVDHLVVYPFTKEFASLTYKEFIIDLLIGKMNLNTLVVGHDHRLGKNREGSYENIVKLSEKHHFGVEKIDTFLIDEIGISSSKIRKALQEGDVERARKFLGYTFSIHGTVTEGNQLGRSIGFPTANIEATDQHKLIPAQGVYGITLLLDGKEHKAMLNIGSRPTVNTNADNRTIEAHIFDFNQDIYKKEVSIFFHFRVRDEKRFASIEALKKQLINDQMIIKQQLAARKL